MATTSTPGPSASQDRSQVLGPNLGGSLNIGNLNPYLDTTTHIPVPGDYGSDLQGAQDYINARNDYISQMGWVGPLNIYTYTHPTPNDQFGNPPPTDQPDFYAASEEDFNFDQQFGILGTFYGSNVRMASQAPINFSGDVISQTLSARTPSPATTSGNLDTIGINVGVDWTLSEKVRTFGTPEYFRQLGADVNVPDTTPSVINMLHQIEPQWDPIRDGFQGVSKTESNATVNNLINMSLQSQGVTSSYHSISGPTYVSDNSHLNDAWFNAASKQPALPSFNGEAEHAAVERADGSYFYSFAPLHNTVVTGYQPLDRFYGNGTGAFASARYFI